MTAPILRLLFLAAPFCSVPSLAEYADLPQTAAVLLLATAALAVRMFGAARRGRLELPRAAVAAEFALFIAWSFLSLVWATDRYLALGDAAHFLACGAVFYLVATGRRGISRELGVVDALLAAWAGVIAVGLAQAIFGFDRIEQAAAPASLFANRNMACQYVVTVLPFALARIFLPGRPAVRGAVFVTALGALLFVLLAQSRAAMLAAAAVFAVAAASIALSRYPFAAAPFRSRRAALFSLALLVALPLGAAPRLAGRSFAAQTWRPLSSVAGELQARSRIPSSAQVRVGLWRNGIEIARDHLLLGVGGGNFEVFYPPYNRETSADRLYGFEKQARFAHNEYLQVLVDYGAIGLLLFLAFLFGLAAAAWRVAREGAPGGDRLLALASLAATASFAIFAFFSFPLHRSMPPLLLALSAGIAARGAGRMEGRGGGRTVALPRAAGVLAAGAAMSLAVAALAWTSAELRGDYHLNRAGSAYRAEDWPSALHEGLLSNEACPLRVDGLAVAGAAALRLDRPGRAAPLLSRVLETRPWHLNSLLNLGVARTSLGRPAEGARQTERALALVPGNGIAHANLGYQYLKAEEFRKALEHLRAAIGAGYDDALRHSQVGYALYRLGRYGESAEEFETALELDPGRADAHRYLATLYTDHLGDPERGAAHVRAAGKLEGDTDPVPAGAE